MHENMDAARLYLSLAAVEAEDVVAKSVLADALEDAGFPEAQALQQLLAQARAADPCGRDALRRLWSEAVEWARRRYCETLKRRLLFAKRRDLETMEAVADALEGAEYPEAATFREAVRRARAAVANGRSGQSPKTWKRLALVRLDAQLWLISHSPL